MSRRVEIDTAPPFGSVKEAVVLFGERILAGEIYAARLNQMRESEGKNESTCSSNKLEAVKAELEETKQCLEKAREETQEMENYVVSLQQELGMAKRELEELKKKACERKVDDGEPGEHVDKLVEMAKEIVVERSTERVDGAPADVRKKRTSSVRFASPPTLLAQVTATTAATDDCPSLERRFSTKETSSTKKKGKCKKMLMIPLLGGLLPRRKGW